MSKTTYQYEMAGDTPRPPTTKKALGLIRARSCISSTSFPRIPRRSSSLYSTRSDSSNDQPTVTSTRTPSYSSSSYQIEVVKRRPNDQRNSHNTRYSLRSFLEDPFSDSDPIVVQETPTKFTGKLQLEKHNRSRNSPHGLTIRWSSGSYNNSLSGRTSSLPGCSIGSMSIPNPPNGPNDYKALETPQYFSPLNLPITFVDVQTTTSRPQIGFGKQCVSVTINVSADVSFVPLPEPSNLAPLDILILLDNVPQISDSSLAQYTQGSTILASHTIPHHDRIALGFVDGALSDQFQLLLPLGFHSEDEVRAALDIFSRRSSFGKQKMVDPGVAIQESCTIFGSSPRIAYCHLFLVSFQPPTKYSVPWIDPAIGFHTITPQGCLYWSYANRQPGWHILYGVDTEKANSSRNDFTRRVSNVLRQIRLGLRPGCLENVEVALTPAPKCQLETVQRIYQLASLRPGETWSLPVNVVVPIALQELDRDELHKLPPVARETIVGINKFLMGWVRDIPEQILNVHVAYRHSLLPAACTVKLESHVATSSLCSRYTAGSTMADSRKQTTLSVQPGETFIFTPA